MDTDDLSKETYRAIIIEAERFNHDLTLQFGLLSGHCKDEPEFIEEVANLIDIIKRADQDVLESIFFGEVPNLTSLHNALDKISENILTVKKIPMAKRHFDF